MCLVNSIFILWSCHDRDKWAQHCDDDGNKRNENKQLFEALLFPVESTTEWVVVILMVYNSQFRDFLKKLRGFQNTLVYLWMNDSNSQYGWEDKSFENYYKNSTEVFDHVFAYNYILNPTTFSLKFLK